MSANSPVVAAPRRRVPFTAFVLAGSASLAAMHAGMLRALYEAGITPDLLVGTSAGALNAAYIASRPQTPETAQELGRVWCELHREDVFPVRPLALIGALANHRDHMVPTRPLRRLVSRHLELERIEDAPTPLHLVAFDLHSGNEVRLSEGSVLDAVLAATAIPGVLAPVPWDERLLVDGAVLNNAPISHAIELGARRIYVLATHDPTDRALPTARYGALNSAVHVLTRLLAMRLDAELSRYADAVELTVLPASNPEAVQPTDFGHAEHLIATALQTARRTLGEGRVREALAA